MTYAPSWLPEHDAALRKHLAAMMSFSQAAAAINAEFRTSYSRNAAIGRGNRIGLKSQCPKFAGDRKPRSRKDEPTAIGIIDRTKRRKTAPQQFACEPATGLRVADVVPQHLSVLELADGLCKWPYGDGPFTFCGCEQFPGEVYCEPHSALSTRPAHERGWNNPAVSARLRNMAGNTIALAGLTDREDAV